MPSSPGQNEGAGRVESPPPSLQSTYTTCPPEDRQSQPESVTGIDPISASGETVERQPEPDHESEAESHIPDAMIKSIEDEGGVRDAPSPVTSQDLSDHDARLAQSLSHATLSPTSCAPEWPLSPTEGKRVSQTLEPESAKATLTYD